METARHVIPVHPLSHDLFALVEESIRNASDDVTARDPEILMRLAASGYLRFSETALRAYLETYETITCPPEVKVWVDRFPHEIKWKRAAGFLAGINRSFPDLGIAVMIEEAENRSWFHELAHIVFGTIPRREREALTCAVTAVYPTVPSPEIEDELCLKIENRLCAFTHGGPEGEDHEILAIVFAEHCGGFKLENEVRRRLDRIIAFYEA